MRGLGVERVVMAGSVAALAVLVVLPLASLVWGSVSLDGRPTLEHFREAVGSRLYLQALRNSLVQRVGAHVDHEAATVFTA
jgi:ABC-type Fe3+ transport system permease subunit